MFSLGRRWRWRSASFRQGAEACFLFWGLVERWGVGFKWIGSLYSSLYVLALLLDLFFYVFLFAHHTYLLHLRYVSLFLQLCLVRLKKLLHFAEHKEKNMQKTAWLVWFPLFRLWVKKMPPLGTTGFGKHFSFYQQFSFRYPICLIHTHLKTQKQPWFC